MAKGKSKLAGNRAGGGARSTEEFINDMVNAMTRNYDSETEYPMSNSDLQGAVEAFAMMNKGVDEDKLLDQIRDRVETVEVNKTYEKVFNGKADLNDISKLQDGLKVDKAKFTSNGNSVKFQAVEIEKNGKKIDVRFSTQYDPLQINKNPKTKIETKIESVLWENGNAKAIRTIKSVKTTSLKNAKTQYEDMLSEWKKATGQRKIEF